MIDTRRIDYHLFIGSFAIRFIIIFINLFVFILSLFEIT